MNKKKMIEEHERHERLVRGYALYLADDCFDTRAVKGVLRVEPEITALYLRDDQKTYMVCMSFQLKANTSGKLLAKIVTGLNSNFGYDDKDETQIYFYDFPRISLSSVFDPRDAEAWHAEQTKQEEKAS